MKNEIKDQLKLEFQEAWEHKRFLHEVRYNFINGLFVFFVAIFSLIIALGEDILENGISNTYEVITLNIAFTLSGFMIIYVYLRNSKNNKLINFYEHIVHNTRKLLYAEEYENYDKWLNVFSNESQLIKNRNKYSIGKFTNLMLYIMFTINVTLHLAMLSLVNRNSVNDFIWFFSLASIIIYSVMMGNYIKNLSKLEMDIIDLRKIKNNEKIT